MFHGVEGMDTSGRRIFCFTSLDSQFFLNLPTFLFLHNLAVCDPPLSIHRTQFTFTQLRSSAPLLHEQESSTPG